ncbi:MAG: hypothetical protein JNN08_02385 [Bryobacterales bacterium]|nr:hypothetical protein [Bryobacterales bacterium]
MPIVYDDSDAKKATELVSQQKKLESGVASLLAKVNKGYFSGKDVVLKSGLSKSDVQKILEAQTKVNALSKQIDTLEKSFKSKLQSAVNGQKEALKRQLATLESEASKEASKFPSGSLYGVVGHGPESDLKKALAEMK